MLITLVVLLAGSLILFYVVAPLVVLFVTKHPAEPSIEPLDPQLMRPELAAFVRHVAGSLATQGFAPAACLRWPNGAAHTDAQMVLFTNPSSKENAAVFDLRVTMAGAEHVSQTYVEFSTEFVNGTEVCTHNSRTPGVTRPDPRKRVFRFPEVKNPLVLYGAHRRLVERHAPQSAARFIPTPGTEHLHLAHSIITSHARQAEFGYLYLDRATASYRPTLKGACLMTWKLLWPIKQVRGSLEKRRAGETLRSLGA